MSKRKAGAPPTAASSVEPPTAVSALSVGHAARAAQASASAAAASALAGGLTGAGASAAAAAAPPAKRARQDNKQWHCEHNRQRSRCKDCGGKEICPHERLRYTCKECQGKGVCPHGKRKSRCKECKESGAGGSQICQHEYGLRLAYCISPAPPIPPTRPCMLHPSTCTHDATSQHALAKVRVLRARPRASVRLPPRFGAVAPPTPPVLAI